MLEVHVVVPRAMDEVQLAESVGRGVKAARPPGDVALLVALVVALHARLTHVPLSVHGIVVSPVGDGRDGDSALENVLGQDSIEKN